MRLVQSQKGVSSVEMSEDVNVRRRLEAYLEMIPKNDPVLRDITVRLENRLIAISSRPKSA